MAAVQLRQPRFVAGGRGVSDTELVATTDDDRDDDRRALEERVTLLELLDRVLDKGVVLHGDITLSVADVDLIYVGLRVLITSVEAMQRAGAAAEDTG